MDDDLDLSRLARTIGEPTRIRMLDLLMAGRALTAKELAYGAGVEPATATTHLQRLGADGFIEATAQGRHKYFRLASPQVAQLIEAPMALAPPAALRSTRHSRTDDLRCALLLRPFGRPARHRPDPHTAAAPAVAAHRKARLRSAPPANAGATPSASTGGICGAPGAASRILAWTGANGATISAARSGRRWRSGCWT